jgi:hypothetical protein
MEPKLASPALAIAVAAFSVMIGACVQEADVFGERPPWTRNIRLGMSSDEVSKALPFHLALDPASFLYVDPPTPDQLRRDAVVVGHDPSGTFHFYFNAADELVCVSNYVWLYGPPNPTDYE